MKQEQHERIIAARARYMSALRKRAGAGEGQEMADPFNANPVQAEIARLEALGHEAEAARLEYELEYEMARATEMQEHFKRQDRAAYLIGGATLLYAVAFVAWAVITITTPAPIAPTPTVNVHVPPQPAPIIHNFDCPQEPNGDKSHRD